MSFLKAGMIYAVGNVVSAAVPFMLLPILTRVLSPEQYGQVVNFALLVTLSLAIAGLNVHAAISVAWFKRPREEMRALVGASLSLATGSSLVVALLAAAIICLWPTLSRGLSPAWGAVAALTAGANVLLQCRLALWQSQNKAMNSAILQFAASILNVLLSLAAVLLLGLGGEGRNAAIAVSAVMMAFVVIVQFQRSSEVEWSLRADHVKHLALFGLPLVFHIFGGVLLSTADRWIISIQLGTESLGIYGAGAQLGMAMALLADAFVKAYGPWIYVRLASENTDDKQCAVGAIYTAIPVFLVMAACLWIVLHFASGTILGPQYREATRVLPWFMLGGACTGIYVSTSVLFFFSSRTALLSTVTLSTAIIGTLLTWFLVGQLGLDGAAIGYALTQALLAVFVTAVAIYTFDLPWSDVSGALRIWMQRALGRSGQQPANQQV